ncbi:hypothetical protein AKJ62_03130 [candidate division MSBL1 archaeon SCGC-AAA259D14]|uniref:Uncharacterized protein n=1 Tax=candidate division MSBL1 archaeon SCGC-AAA259D14 TaxID=1698261 RepID=A0A133U5H2_9EURY|nr:hypothetical protein AKJ62_03130 [candidate division MSBL1 archaeon SCGC-AAA259D14]
MRISVTKDKIARTTATTTKLRNTLRIFKRSMAGLEMVYRIEDVMAKNPIAIVAARWREKPRISMKKAAAPVVTIASEKG